jgi:hypothetical protein
MVRDDRCQEGIIQGVSGSSIENRAVLKGLNEILGGGRGTLDPGAV